MHLNALVQVKKIKVFLGQTWVKYVLGFIIFGFILYEIKRRSSELSIGENFVELLHGISMKQLTVIMLLIVANWGFEALKWHFLISKIHNYSFFQSFKSVMVGLSWGIFTPHRIGEYGGRVVLLPEGKRLMAGALNFVSSLSQNIVHFVVGLLSLTFIGQGFLGALSNGFIGLAILLTLVLLWVYFNINRFARFLLGRLKNAALLRKWLPEHPVSIAYLDSALLLVLSFVMYLCYVGLFAYLIIVQKPQFYDQALLFHISVIFLLQSGIPLPSGLALLARIEIAILVLSQMGIGVNVIILSSALVWILNIGIPALFGAIFMLPERKQVKGNPH